VSANITRANGAVVVPPAIAVTSDTWRCILGMLTDMTAHFRYLPLVVLPPLQQEQFVHVQLLPHLQPEPPSLPMKHNKEDAQL